MAEQNNEPQTPREIEETLGSQRATQRIEALKEPPTSIQETPQNQDSGPENLNPNQTKNKIGEEKSKKSNPDTKDIEKELIKKVGKKVLMNPATWVAIGWALVVIAGVILAAFLIFSFAMVYQCAEKKGVLGTLWTTSFGTNFIPLLEESVSGDCIAETTLAPTDDAPPAKAATPAAIPPDQTAQ